MLDVNYIEGDTAHRLRQYASGVGLTVQTVMRDEARLAGQNAVKFTYPRKKSDGTKRVEKDIRKIFTPMSPAEIQSEWDIPGVLGGSKAFKTKSGAVYGVDADHYKPNASMDHLAKEHEKHRQPASGRVTTARGGSETGRNSLNIGRWKFVTKTHAKPGRIKQFVKRQQKKVGQQKAGWMPALEYFARMSKSAIRAPAWVKGQEKRSGHYVDTTTRGGNGSVELVNTVSYWPDKKRIALENVVHGIARKRLDNPRTWRGLDKLAARFNDGRKVAA